MSTRPEGSSSSDLEPVNSQAAAQPFARDTSNVTRTTLGSLFLYFAVFFVVGISVGALTGTIDPVLGAFIVLGSEVLGTIAFFLTYYIGRRPSE